MLGSVSTAHAANVQDQADCARVAQKDFDEAKGSSAGKTLSSFESHYNTKMHACLVLLHFYYAEDYRTGHTLIDEIGNHIYADYMSSRGNTKIAWCFFEPAPYAERKSCNSLDEFMAGIKPYMTE